MNNVLYEFLDAFMVVYLDDIIIYSKTLEDNINHLRWAFKRLREHKLYMKKGKYEFA